MSDASRPSWLSASASEIENSEERLFKSDALDAGGVAFSLQLAEVVDAAPGASIAELTDAWVPVTVPGDLHKALERAGRLGDLDAGDADEEAGWVEDREWWYRFTVPATSGGDRLRLLLHGLDAFADVWIDESLVGTSRNMFRPLELDVTASLERDAVVHVRFRRPLDQVDMSGAEMPFVQGPQSFMRKAQYGYGWDFAPRRPSVGIWRPVEVVRDRGGVIRGTHARTLFLAADHSSAIIGVDVDVEHLDDSELFIDVHLDAPDGAVVGSSAAAVLEGRASVHLDVPNPQLWWPHDHGDPALHKVVVALRSGSEVVDTWSADVGIRTIFLDESADDEDLNARHFRFVVNGTPIFAKGANWVPVTMAVGEIDSSRYAHLLGAARDANMNMLRVWGGGIYEHDLFYEMCDRLGLLVWQEFMFACASYDDNNESLLEEVEAEARYQVRRLRSHACLSLWCGNNEVELIFGVFGGGLLERAVPNGNRIFYDLLPKVVAEEDPHTGYIPSSPLMGNSVLQGDRHSWEIWHGLDAGDLAASGTPRPEVNLNMDVGELEPGSSEAEDFLARTSPNRYLEDRTRFSSEFGLLSGPTRDTFSHWGGDPEAAIDATLAHRLRDHIGPKNKLELVAQSRLGQIKSFGDLIDGSQLHQADGLMLGIEHYRRRRPHCSGTLIWQLNDCWPGFTWSLMDFDGRPKLAYHAARRAYSPRLASFATLPDGGVGLWAINDGQGLSSETLRVQLATFEGGMVWERHIAAAVRSRTASELARFDADELSPRSGQYLRVTSPTGVFVGNRYLFPGVRPPEVVQPEMTLIRTDGDTASVVLTADRYVVAAELTHPDASVRFDDGYVDVAPGEERIVNVHLGPKGDLHAIRVRAC